MIGKHLGEEALEDLEQIEELDTEHLSCEIIERKLEISKHQHRLRDMYISKEKFDNF